MKFFITHICAYPMHMSYATVLISSGKWLLDLDEYSSAWFISTVLFNCLITHSCHELLDYKLFFFRFSLVLHPFINVARSLSLSLSHSVSLHDVSVTAPRFWGVSHRFLWRHFFNNCETSDERISYPRLCLRLYLNTFHGPTRRPNTNPDAERHSTWKENHHETEKKITSVTLSRGGPEDKQRWAHFRCVEKKKPTQPEEKKLFLPTVQKKKFHSVQMLWDNHHPFWTINQDHLMLLTLLKRICIINVISHSALRKQKEFYNCIFHTKKSKNQIQVRVFKISNRKSFD